MTNDSSCPVYSARNCVAAIQKRFTHRSANVQLFSLTVRPILPSCSRSRTGRRAIRADHLLPPPLPQLAGALVNNCSGSLHREISGKAFTQALVRLVNDRVSFHFHLLRAWGGEQT